MKTFGENVFIERVIILEKDKEKLLPAGWIKSSTPLILLWKLWQHVDVSGSSLSAVSAFFSLSHVAGNASAKSF